MRTDGVTEHRRVVTLPQPVRAGLLLIGHPDREVSEAVDLVVDDRAVTQGRRNQRVGLSAESAE